MSEQFETVSAAAMALPEAERAALVNRLYESLPSEELEQDEWDKLWLAEVDRRLQEIDQGKTVAVPVADAMKWLEERFP